MKKIAIIGCGGAGKSTLAKHLGALLQIPVYHLDAIFWLPGWVPMERDAFYKEQQQIMDKDRWIIDGNYGGTMEQRLAEADTIIFLHFTTIRCLYGITKRRLQYRNQTRPDMGENCPEKLDWEFFHWVRTFNRTKAPAINEQLSHLKDKQIHVFKKPNHVRKFLNDMNVNNISFDS